MDFLLKEIEFMKVSLKKESDSDKEQKIETLEEIIQKRKQKNDIYHKIEKI